MKTAHWRVNELKYHSRDISWLDAAEARRAYELVRLYGLKSHRGFNTQTVGAVERLEFDEDVAIATDWLRARMPGSQELVVVFGGDECFKCNSDFFIGSSRSSTHGATKLYF